MVHFPDFLDGLYGSLDVGIPLAQAPAHVRDLRGLEAQPELEEQIRDGRDCDVHVRHAGLQK